MRLNYPADHRLFFSQHMVHKLQAQSYRKLVVPLAVCLTLQQLPAFVQLLNNSNDSADAMSAEL